MLTGTYRAEQISNVSFDIVSAGASHNRTHIGRAGAISPSPDASASSSPRHRRKKSSQRIGKCTMLPALENIDTLFKNREDQSGDGKSDSDDPCLDTIEEVPDADDEVEFREWLKLPSLVDNLRGESAASTWHVLLSQKSFHTHSDYYITACLIQVMGFEPHAAYDTALELRKRRLMVLAEFSDKREAFRKLQKLRSRGLQVLVAMHFGLPGDGQVVVPTAPDGEEPAKRRSADGQAIAKRPHRRRSKQSPREHMRSYTELFYRAGADRSTPRHVQVSPGRKAAKDQTDLSRWRSAQSGSFEQNVLPEDPVAVFLLEEKRTADQEALQPSKGKSLQALLTKYRTELQLKEQEDQERKAILAGTFHEGYIQAKQEAQLLAESKAAASPLPAPGGEAVKAPVPESMKPKESTPDRKEACALMRFFLFGYLGNEDAKDQDEREAIFRESAGTKEQVRVLYWMWSNLDDNNSGRCDFSEFRVFAETKIREMSDPDSTETDVKNHRATLKAPVRPRLQHGATMVLKTTSAADLRRQATEDTVKFSAALCEKLSGALLGKKSSFVLEDIMRLIWLFATQSEVRIMRAWCREFYEEALRDRVEAPPILDVKELEGLRSVFDHFDEHKAGEIHFDTLVIKGLIYSEQVEEYRLQWDDDGNGLLSLSEFCEMMCPVGFRATAKSEVGSLADARRVFMDKHGNWKLEQVQEEAPDISAQVSARIRADACAAPPGEDLLL